jgi:hypothetical protein
MDQIIEDRERRTDSDAMQALQGRQQAGEFDDDPARLCREINYLSWGATFADPVVALEVPDVCVHENEWPTNLGPHLEALLGSYGDYDWRPELRVVTAPRLVIHGIEDNIPLEGSKACWSFKRRGTGRTTRTGEWSSIRSRAFCRVGGRRERSLWDRSRLKAQVCC